MMTQRWNPGALLELSGAFWKTCALHAAVKLDVFSVIGDDQLSAETIATGINGSLKGVERLLNALVAMDLLEKNDQAYGNIAGVGDFLSKQSPKYIGHIILHHHHLVEGWSQLDQAVVTGQPIRSRSSFSKEEWRESFLLGMFNLAMNLAPQLVPLIDLSAKGHLLDLGGGPGTYAIHFCLNNPELKATVFDLPTTKPSKNFRWPIASISWRAIMWKMKLTVNMMPPGFLIFCMVKDRKPAGKLFRKPCQPWSRGQPSLCMILSLITQWTDRCFRRYFP